MSTLLITTGATVTFKLLLDYVVTESFISKLLAINVNKLIVQYGNEIKLSKKHGSTHVSDLYFEELLQKSRIVNHLKLKANSKAVPKSEEPVKIYTSSESDFQLIAFPFSNKIDNYIAQSDVVISHAGTGSIVDTLRLQKKLIVIVNDTLMDNHQAEIAHEFTKLNYCLSYNVRELAKKDELVNSLRDLLKGDISLTQFPVNKKKFVESVIAEELVHTI
ncbi:UDP-N-acetylglucosamine transferase subunit ALG13 [Scheffersomyces xylosifermentans]|uniref:UDP-N-acetylglucosamine transferase subunit ALG13 n=1 Tax=Scheffersomyces xylosifermentans TaxID=1304137 RepID=UPI00315DD915